MATIGIVAVRFSQDSIKGAFRNGMTLNEAVDALRAGGAEAATKFSPHPFGGTKGSCLR